MIEVVIGTGKEQSNTDHTGDVLTNDRNKRMVSGRHVPGAASVSEVWRPTTVQKPSVCRHRTSVSR
jgi:hypothetical protein